MTEEVFNLASYFLDRHLEAGDGGRIAIVTRRAMYSYAQVAERANRAAGVFRDLGVGREDRVLIALPDGVDAVAACLGAVRLGGLAVPVHASTRSKQLLTLLEDARPRVIVVDEAGLEQLRQVRERVRPDGLLVVGETAPAWSWRRRLNDVEPLTETAATAPRDAAFVLYTGRGSSGGRIFYRQQDLFELGDRLARAVSARPDDRILCTATLGAGYGLCAALAVPFSTGAAAVLQSQPARPDALPQLIAHFRPTLVFSTPSTYQHLVERVTALELASVRELVSAEEPLPEALARNFPSRFGFDLMDASSHATSPAMAWGV